MRGSERAKEWLEARALSSRAGRSGRAFADERLDAYLRANWRTLVVAIAVSLPFILVPVWLVDWGSGMRGFVLGVSLTALLFGAYHWCVIASGAAGSRMGATAEQWTDMELRRLRRSGWRIVNHVVLRRRDIDHIAIGPDGVIVVETKWTSSKVRLDGSDRWLADAVAQVRENANDIRKVLGWNSFTDAVVAPLVVVWGPRVRPESDELVPGGDGVELVAGENLHLTLDLLGHRALTDDQIDDAYRKITQHVTRRDARDADTDDSDRLITAMVRGWGIRLAAFLAGFGVAALLLNLGSVPYLVVNVAVIAVGVLLLRQGSTRSLGAPWLIGSQLVTLVAIADVVLRAMT
jgi:hypothetical protein